ncbi:MBL fold metallo-hydrolase [Methanolobus sp. ZRKC5]|uniref:MBL fold metallo-hydrolase n=1 Tax=unclassified Methanolobus TaxID=2629569 RepID=UPI00313ED19A
MLIQQIFTEKIAHSSYILAGDRTCAVIDPRRDIEIYLELTRELGVKITHILETHLHADFISGHIDLAQRTGAAIYAPLSANCDFEYVALSEGDSFSIENIKLDILETPGHTPEHISYVVTDASRGEEPVALFCGDTMFVGDVGRPDLFPGKAEELASKLYDTLHEKILKLPDFCEIYPAHGAGSLCGRAMAAKRSSTLGYEKKYNYALNINERADFIKSLTNNMPDAPDHFSRCTNVNRTGPERVKELPIPEALNNVQFREKMKDAIILDVRNFESFGGQHIPQAYNIDSNSNFPTYSGWLLPPEKDILIVSDNYSRAFDACTHLHRVGQDRIAGYLEDGMYGWVTDGLPTKHVPQISSSELHSRINNGKKMTLLDVRAVSEYDEFHIDGAVNIPVHELRERHAEINDDAETILICGSGQRSSMGCSILLQNEFTKVQNAAGGMTGYATAGYGPECPMCVLPWAPFKNK